MALEKCEALACKDFLPYICSSCVDMSDDDALGTTSSRYRIVLREESHTVTTRVRGNEPELFNRDECVIIQVQAQDPPYRSLQEIVLRQSDHQGCSPLDQVPP